MGNEGRALAEELGDRSHKHHRYFNRFKVDHPDELLLFHFTGDARGDAADPSRRGAPDKLYSSCGVYDGPGYEPRRLNSELGYHVAVG